VQSHSSRGSISLASIYSDTDVCAAPSQSSAGVPVTVIVRSSSEQSHSSVSELTGKTHVPEKLSALQSLTVGSSQVSTPCNSQNISPNGSSVILSWGCSFSRQRTSRISMVDWLSPAKQCGVNKIFWPVLVQRWQSGDSPALYISSVSHSTTPESTAFSVGGGQPQSTALTEQKSSMHLYQTQPPSGASVRTCSPLRSLQQPSPTPVKVSVKLCGTLGTQHAHGSTQIGSAIPPPPPSPQHQNRNTRTMPE
jgi:hypothetical protein